MSPNGAGTGPKPPESEPAVRLGRLDKTSPWLTKPMCELTPGDFSLDRQASNNLAIDGATNLTDAGANLTTLPTPADSAGDAAGELNRD